MTVSADETPAVGPPTDAAGLSARAMRWFTEMMAGRADRSQYAPAFAPQVTDAAVARIAHDLNRYGAAPLRAEIVQTKKDGDQTFAIVGKGRSAAPETTRLARDAHSYPAAAFMSETRSSPFAPVASLARAASDRFLAYSNPGTLARKSGNGRNSSLARRWQPKGPPLV
jgi:hypothetical protein